jgi:putative transposase
MRRVEQHVIERSHPKFRQIDEPAFASKNRWNLANYHVRQAFFVEGISLNNAALYPLLQASISWRLSPRISQVSLHAWSMAVP